MRIKFHRPSENLGCAGVTVGGFYADIYPRPWMRWPWRWGIFVNAWGTRLWVTERQVRRD